ncbi:PPOX class F420-dependent oxidoreductase [Candidatus Bathyarchaeota archaeon]|nr:MAG: PPOX class F420-dependent oxidoreductase [Candidatus Bathyarchaeota archaeon]
MDCLEKMMTQRTRRTTGADFTEKELRYLMERSLGRLAFVCSDTQAHIMPVLFEFDGAYFYLSGWNLKYSERFQDVSPNSKVTLLVDDVESPTRWVPRGVEITGEAESREKGNYLYVRIKPVGKTSWGL